MMNLLGIDFEDWFHPELIQPHVKNKPHEPTVINGIDKILDWLRKNETFATFFMVGELLEFKPELLDKIINAGHEIGFHTMYHTRVDSPNYKEKLVKEIKKFSTLSEKKSIGFRAPSLSLNHSCSWVIDVLQENGYTYDSSVMPAKTSLYGLPGAEKKPYRISSTSLVKNDPQGKLWEFPLLTAKIFGRTIPAAGGFYLRVLPQRIIKNAIAINNERNIPATFYIHSWELAPEFMPKISLPIRDRFITYYNLGKAFSRMTSLLKKFKFTSFSRFISENLI